MKTWKLKNFKHAVKSKHYPKCQIKTVNPKIKNSTSNPKILTFKPIIAIQKPFNNVQNLWNIPLPSVLQNEITDPSIQHLSKLTIQYSLEWLETWRGTFFKIYFLWKTQRNVIERIKLLFRVIEYTALRFIFSLTMLLP